MVTLVGNLCSEPVKKVNPPAGNNKEESTLVTFRVACDRKIFTGQEDHGKPIFDSTDILYMPVECWGALAVNAAETLHTGSPVVITGKLYTSMWEEQVEGVNQPVKRSMIRCRAFHIGPDLLRGMFMPYAKVCSMADEMAKEKGKERRAADRAQRAQQPQQQAPDPRIRREEVRSNPSTNAA